MLSSMERPVGYKNLITPPRCTRESHRRDGRDGAHEPRQPPTRPMKVWLPRTSYVLRRLRLRTCSDSLQACGPSLFRCSTRSDLLSSRAPRCTWKSSRSDTNWPSSIDRGARVFASRRPIESCGRGSRTHGPTGARPFISSNRRRSSCGITAVFACSGPGKADTAPGARAYRLTSAR